jgi:hypothetical protein
MKRDLARCEFCGHGRMRFQVVELDDDVFHRHGAHPVTFGKIVWIGLADD